MFVVCSTHCQIWDTALSSLGVKLWISYVEAHLHRQGKEEEAFTMLEYCVGEAFAMCSLNSKSSLCLRHTEWFAILSQWSNSASTFDCPFQSVMTLELQASNVLLALHQIAALSNPFSHASLWSRSIRHITNFNITDQIRSRRGTMRVVGERSFPIHSARRRNDRAWTEKAAPMRHHFDLPREPWEK